MEVCPSLASISGFCNQLDLRSQDKRKRINQKGRAAHSIQESDYTGLPFYSEALRPEWQLVRGSSFFCFLRKVGLAKKSHSLRK